MFFSLVLYFIFTFLSFATVSQKLYFNSRFLRASLKGFHVNASKIQSLTFALNAGWKATLKDDIASVSLLIYKALSELIYLICKGEETSGTFFPPSLHIHFSRMLYSVYLTSSLLHQISGLAGFAGWVLARDCEGGD